MNNSNMELIDFDNTNSPGKQDGNEIFTFRADNTNLFSYVKNGEISSYILYAEKWYLVLNPSDPLNDEISPLVDREKRKRWLEIEKMQIQDLE